MHGYRSSPLRLPEGRKAHGWDDTAAARWLCAWLALSLVVHLALLMSSGAGLHVDEAQYAWWSRDLQWGYYSKPPAIAALIRASTELFGDGPMGIRLLPMLCWLGCAALIHRMGRDIAGRRAGLWGAGVFLASPLAMFGGMVATTDAPLMLCWALAMSLAWRAVHWDHPPYWCVWSVVLAAGVLSKPTMLALVPATAWWAWWVQGRRGLLHACLATAVALLLVSPWLAWNHQMGWPTWHHLRASTDGATAAGTSTTARLALLVASQGLLLGPVAWLLAWRHRHRLSAWQMTPRPRRQAATAALQAIGLVLLVAGLAQAWRGRFEVNWLAPLHIALAVWLGSRLAPAGREEPVASRRVVRAALLLLAQALCTVALCALPAVWNALHPGSFPPPSLDVWARMRGWDAAFASWELHARRWPGGVLTSESRTVLMQATHAWRHLDVVPAGFSEDGQLRHHADLICPWAHASRSGRPVIFLNDQVPTAEQRRRLGTIVAEDHLRLPRSRDRWLDLYLVVGLPEPDQSVAKRACP